MKKIITLNFLIFLISAISINQAVSQDKAVKQMKLVDFKLQSSAVIGSTGNVISSPSYQSKVYWFPVKVPSTVLSGLVANHIYPDPYAGLNNMLIPDASDEFNKEYNLEQYSYLPGQPNPWKMPYWYRTSFQVPASDKGRFFELIFKGINYRAAVWLNGQQIADSSRMAGMFAEYKLDVSKQIIPGEKNYLAVKIYPLDYPGLPSQEQLKAMGDFFANGGPTGDIGKNVTMLCSVGWDWIPPVRDRNIGIWQPVYLRTSGPVTIEHPHVITELPDLPDTGKADVSFNFLISNHKNSPANGTLEIKINPENFTGSNIEFSKPVSVEAMKSKMVKFDPENVKELTIIHPHLWWPSGHGNPYLYRMTVQYKDENGLSDEISMVFGIRTVSSKTTQVKDKSIRRDFYVNGRRVNLVGGAWVPDMMLNRDSTRYADELELCRNANANLIRIWGGGITPPDVFFDIADRLGLLVWSDFWITGDTQGEFKGSPDWPLDGNIFIKNMTSTIYRIRNHPSLLVWTGGNEGHARKELYDAMRDSVSILDGTRPFIPSSSGFAKLPEGWKGSWPDDKPSGVYSGGPYSWKDPHFYYDLADNAKDWVFKDETGIPSQPPYNTLSRIIPDLVWDKSLPFPLNNSWGYHDAATGNGRYDLYYKEGVSRYGEPESMKDFSNKMQLMNANGYQAIFEAAGHKLDENGGVMLWKLNAAFPSVMWQIYDWYLEPNAGYYFMQNACEPVHIQLNLDDSSVAVINRTYSPVAGLKANVSAYDIKGKLIYQNSSRTDVDASNVKKVLSLSKFLNGTKDLIFLILNLNDNKGILVSHNAYWLSSSNNFTSLRDLPITNIDAQLVNTSESAHEKKWTVRITNKSDKIAFFIRPRLMNEGEEVLPSFWSAGYFTLEPAESLNVSVSVPDRLIKNGELSLNFSGWNTGVERIIINP